MLATQGQRADVVFFVVKGASSICDERRVLRDLDADTNFRGAYHICRQRPQRLRGHKVHLGCKYMYLHPTANMFAVAPTRHMSGLFFQRMEGTGGGSDEVGARICLTLLAL